MTLPSFLPFLPETGDGLRIGVVSERLYYSADDFDDAPYRYTTVNNECTFEKPVAHYQCVRFDVADSLLQGLGLPVIAADIDTLVLGGTSSLSVRTDDVILNFNPLATGFAALITANLLRLRPTPGARRPAFHGERACLSAG